jgi:L-ascorbate metabolism protein UlaG (beta-lactamase superfamily)
MMIRLVSALSLLLLAVHPAAALPPGWPTFLPSGRAAPGHVEAWFMGNTTLLFRVGDDALMIDGFVSRPSFRQIFFERISPKEKLIRRRLAQTGIAIREGAPGAALHAVLVAHAHYDHAMDAPTVARLTGATMAGSSSAKQVALGHGLPEQRFCLLAPNRPYQFGPFGVQVFWFRHGWPDLFYGAIRRPVPLSAPAGAYLDTGSYAFLITRGELRILVQPSAGFRAADYKKTRADILFLSLGGVGLRSDVFARRYWNGVAGQTRAKLVVPIHWDDFTRPLNEDLAPSRDGASRAMSRMIAHAGGTPLRLMPLLQPVDLQAALAGLPDHPARTPPAVTPRSAPTGVGCRSAAPSARSSRTAAHRV